MLAYGIRVSLGPIKSPGEVTLPIGLSGMFLDSIAEIFSLEFD